MNLWSLLKIEGMTIIGSIPILATSGCAAVAHIYSEFLSNLHSSLLFSRHWGLSCHFQWAVAVFSHRKEIFLQVNISSRIWRYNIYRKAMCLMTKRETTHSYFSHDVTITHKKRPHGIVWVFSVCCNKHSSSVWVDRTLKVRMQNRENGFILGIGIYFYKCLFLYVMYFKSNFKSKLVCM